jgi:hypothetical protein
VTASRRSRRGSRGREAGPGEALIEPDMQLGQDLTPLEALEEQAGMLLQHHFIWDDGDTDVEAEVAARLASGRAKVVHVVSWSEAPEQDMHPDKYKFTPRPEE